jgi:geranylgeranyl pyrophosphate synthase
LVVLLFSESGVLTIQQLLHDDIVDESKSRRGKETANEVWGNAASVLVGDFLYSRAFEMMGLHLTKAHQFVLPLEIIPLFCV